jgi:hypothetical protein
MYVVCWNASLLRFYVNFPPILTYLSHPAIAIFKPQDVRPILTAYQGKDIPTEYAKVEAEGKKKHIEEWQQNKGSTSNSFGSIFGLSSVRVPCFMYAVR